MHLRLRSRFQFQTGAIKSWSDMLMRGQVYDRFNSKLVRLKDSANALIIAHNHPCFNSKLVRLKVNPGWISWEAFVVSIPNWCD